MVKQVMILAFSLVSISALAQSLPATNGNFVKLSPSRASDYREGITQLLLYKITSLAMIASNLQDGSLRGCPGPAQQAVSQTIFKATDVLIDKDANAEPVLAFAIGLGASQIGETSKIAYVTTVGQEITKITEVTTFFTRDLINKDPRNLQFGIVPHVKTETCDLTPAAQVKADRDDIGRS